MEYNIRQTATLHVPLLWSRQKPRVTMYAFMWSLVIIGVPIYSTRRKTFTHEKGEQVGMDLV